MLKLVYVLLDYDKRELIILYYNLLFYRFKIL